MQITAVSAAHTMQMFATKRTLVQIMQCGVAHPGVGSLQLAQLLVLRLYGKVTIGVSRNVSSMQKLSQAVSGSHFVSVAGNYQLVPLMEKGTLQQIMAAAAQLGTKQVAKRYGKVTPIGVPPRLTMSGVVIPGATSTAAAPSQSSPGWAQVTTLATRPVMMRQPPTTWLRIPVMQHVVFPHVVVGVAGAGAHIHRHGGVLLLRPRHIRGGDRGRRPRRTLLGEGPRRHRHQMCGGEHHHRQCLLPLKHGDEQRASVDNRMPQSLAGVSPAMLIYDDVEQSLSSRTATRTGRR